MQHRQAVTARVGGQGANRMIGLVQPGLRGWTALAETLPDEVAAEHADHRLAGAWDDGGRQRRVR